jgi:hypothetical protein
MNAEQIRSTLRRIANEVEDNEWQDIILDIADNRYRHKLQWRYGRISPIGKGSGILITEDLSAMDLINFLRENDFSTEADRTIAKHLSHQKTNNIINDNHIRDFVVEKCPGASETTIAWNVNRIKELKNIKKRKPFTFDGGKIIDINGVKFINNVANISGISTSSTSPFRKMSEICSEWEKDLRLYDNNIIDWKRAGKYVRK